MTGLDHDFYSGMTQSDMIELKPVLADINNVLTFKATSTVANWLCKLFQFDTNTRKTFLETIDQIKPNTKGFDIYSYYQYLVGMQFFTPAIPCVPTELVAFRQRIGESGAELILKESIRINRTKDDDNFGNAVSLDSTVGQSFQNSSMFAPSKTKIKNKQN